MLFFSDNFFPVESDIVIWSLSLCPADWAVRGFTDGVLVLGEGVCGGGGREEGGGKEGRGARKTRTPHLGWGE